MKKVLLSGFEPFGGEIINPSLELIKHMRDENWEGVEVHLVQLPVVFGESIQRLKEEISRVNPDIVIGIGQAGGRTALSIERIAINVDDAVIGDNKNHQPIDQPVNPDGPAAYFATVPIKKMMQAARDAGVPAYISNSAGTYVCNHLMYGILDTLHGTGRQGGFIHIPFLPEQVHSRPNQPSMSMESLSKGLKAIVIAAVEADGDSKMAAGALD